MYDILVIGGGINGVGIARDAAGRGAKVLLVEKDDLASHTSSASTKLVHGGLRYLEHYEFRLVRESLIERERLLSAAPHIIWPLRFILPHDKGLRPSWLLRLGLFLYDHIGGRKLLPPSRTVDLRANPHGGVLESRLVKGFEYSDCWVEDARLVALTAQDAAQRGCTVETRTQCTALARADDHWTATLQGGGGAARTVQARCVVNAAGPWVDDILGKSKPGTRPNNVKLVKGSHLIFPRLFSGDHCYIFQNADNRIVFAIPYESDFTLVGTTDASFDGDPNDIEISPEESAYICAAINEYLKQDVTVDQAVWSYSGVRPLYDDNSDNNSAITRDYVFDLDAKAGEAPILSIFGGKITTFRKLAEHAMEKLARFGVVADTPWTRSAPLPGGDFPVDGFAELVANMTAQYPWFPATGIHRLCRAYGTNTAEILGSSAAETDLGEHFGGDLYQREVEYLIAHEFVTAADDVLWRRSKLGLHLDRTAHRRLKVWFDKRRDGQAP